MAISSSKRELDGSIILDIDLEFEDVEALGWVIESFVDAVEARMFPPAFLESRQPLLTTAQHVRCTFTVRGLSFSALAVLAGMLGHFASYVGPILNCTARLPGDTIDSFHKWGYPKPLTVCPPRGARVEGEIPSQREPLIITIEFFTDVSEDRRERICAVFAAWEALVRGGFAIEGQPPGESDVGASSVRFISPVMLQYDAEAWLANASFLAPLFAGLDEIARENGIRVIVIE